jgi:radical SAM superfamily enzyme
MWILHQIAQELPFVRRIACYANAKSIAAKSDTELQGLRASGLKTLHLGLESGDDTTLRQMNKYGDSAFIVAQAQRAQRAGFKLFVTVLLGLGGTARTAEHARATAHALTQIDPRYVGALSLMVIPGTPLADLSRNTAFSVVDAAGLLQELHTIIDLSEFSLCLFFANHASNFLPIECRLPREKQRVLHQIRTAIENPHLLKPDFLRAL